MLLQLVFYIFLISIATAIQSQVPTNTASYDPGEILAKIFNPNSTITSRQRGYGLVFENDLPSSPEADNEQNKLVFQDSHSLKFENNPEKPIRFEVITNQGRPDVNLDEGSRRPLKFKDQEITFQDNNAINKKKKRRRKPKKGYQGRPGIPGLQQSSGQNLAFGFQPGFQQDPYINLAAIGPIPFRRRRRPRPSLATDALSAVTGALTSIALYDDYQCVPRLLCEAAGGGSSGSGGVLDSVAGIQPLLTLLSAYNGISSSPLFVFGRAVFLGMTSRGNVASCRYAYPQCPTDPEKLIHYLNNHNGGFFRFFNAPATQNLEQFYQHLGQNQQLIGQEFNQNGFSQDYGYKPGFQGQGSYGLYQHQAAGQQGYGFQSNYQQPGIYGQNYGSNYDYNSYRPNNGRYKIEKRIQNKPAKDDDNFNEQDSNWQFPDNTKHNGNDDGNDEIRDSLKFPEDYEQHEDVRDLRKKGKSILFPENLYNDNAYSNKNYADTNFKITYNTISSTGRPYSQYYDKGTQRPYYDYNYNENVVNNVRKTTAIPLSDNDYYYDHKHNFYVKKSVYDSNNYNNKQYNTAYQNKYQVPVNYVYYNNNHAQINSNYVNKNNDGLQTVYIVRGNSDPARPEIVKVRPGQTVT